MNSVRIGDTVRLQYFGISPLTPGVIVAINGEYILVKVKNRTVDVYRRELEVISRTDKGIEEARQWNITQLKESIKTTQKELVKYKRELKRLEK